MKKKLLLVLAGILVASGVMSYFFLQPTYQPNNIVICSYGNIQQQVITVGQLQPSNFSQVRSPLLGIVSNIDVKEGQFVKKGQVLATIVPTPTPSDLANAVANLAQAQATLEDKRKSYLRFQKLYKLGYIAEQDYDDSKSDFLVAQSNDDLAQQQLNLLRNGTANINGKPISSTLYSPIDGYILQIFVNNGDSVIPVTQYQSGSPLFVVADMSHLVFNGVVSQHDVDNLRMGMSATIQLQSDPNLVITGTLSNISLMDVNNQNTNLNSNQLFDIPTAYTHGYGIQVSNLNIKDNSKLRAGLQATAEFTTQSLQHVLLLPQGVIQYDQNNSPYVMVLKGRHQIKQYLQLGISDSQNVQILSGLEAGDKIAVSSSDDQ